MEPLQHYPNVQIISTIVKGLATDSDEFSEKFQKAFDTPPPHFWNLYCKIFMTNMVAYMRGGMMAR